MANALATKARQKLNALMGDFPQGFNAGAAAGIPGWAGDMAYMVDTGRRALTGQPGISPGDFPGTTDAIARAAGYPVPDSLSGQLGAAVGGLLTPGPGDLGRLAPVAAMFLGAKAKTAMPDVLEYAQAMEKAGKSPDEIWDTTGKLGQPWFKGADGQWRFEIDDSAAEYRPGQVRAEHQQKWMEHNAHELDTFYAAKRMREKMDEGMSVAEAMAWFEREHGRVPEGAGQFLRGFTADELAGYLKQVEERAATTNITNVRAPLSQFLDHPELFAAYPELANLDVRIRDLPPNLGGQASLSYGIDLNNNLAYGLDGGKSILLHEIMHPIQDIEGFDPGGTPAAMGGLDAYLRLMGETEARNVQSRRNMGALSRSSMPPWTTQDFPNEIQIPRRNNLAP